MSLLLFKTYKFRSYVVHEYQKLMRLFGISRVFPMSFNYIKPSSPIISLFLIGTPLFLLDSGQWFYVFVQLSVLVKVQFSNTRLPVTIVSENRVHTRSAKLFYFHRKTE